MNSVVLRKSGGFYVCFDNDAIILFYLCNYKISNGKVGFAINSLNKVINILENNSINYIIKENMEDINKKIYGKKNRYKYFLNKGKSKLDLDYRINNIINKINKLDEDKLLELIDLVESSI